MRKQQKNILLQLFHFIAFAGCFYQFLQEFLAVSRTVQRSCVSCFRTLQLSVLHAFYRTVVVAYNQKFSQLLPAVYSSLSRHVGIVGQVFFCLGRILLIQFQGCTFNAFLRLCIGIFQRILYGAHVFHHQVVARTNHVGHPVVDPESRVP